MTEKTRLTTQREELHRGRVRAMDHEVMFADGSRSHYEVDGSIPFAAATLVIDEGAFAPDSAISLSPDRSGPSEQVQLVRMSDVGAKGELCDVINDLARQGQAVIVVSSCPPELLGPSGRVLVLHEEGIAGELLGGASEEAVLRLASGGVAPSWAALATGMAQAGAADALSCCAEQPRPAGFVIRALTGVAATRRARHLCCSSREWGLVLSLAAATAYDGSWKGRNRSNCRSPSKTGRTRRRPDAFAGSSSVYNPAVTGGVDPIAQGSQPHCKRFGVVGDQRRLQNRLALSCSSHE